MSNQWRPIDLTSLLSSLLTMIRIYWLCSEVLVIFTISGFLEKTPKKSHRLSVCWLHIEVTIRANCDTFYCSFDFIQLFPRQRGFFNKIIRNLW